MIDTICEICNSWEHESSQCPTGNLIEYPDGTKANVLTQGYALVRGGRNKTHPVRLKQNRRRNSWYGRTIVKLARKLPAKWYIVLRDWWDAREMREVYQTLTPTHKIKSRKWLADRLRRDSGHYCPIPEQPQKQDFADSPFRVLADVVTRDDC